jgi:Transposase IS66 family
MNYMLKRIDLFTRFLDDGRICLSNNAAERELRGIALGRKSWLFAGSDEGASYCPSDNLLINQADFAADHEMTGVETCGFWRPAGCLHVRYLSPEQAMARRGMDDRRAGIPAAVHLFPEQSQARRSVHASSTQDGLPVIQAGKMNVAPSFRRTSTCSTPPCSYRPAKTKVCPVSG